MNSKVVLLITPMILIGCVSTQLSRSGRAVIVGHGKAPTGCQYVGPILGSQGDAWSGGFTSNKNLSKGAMNDLRNKAAQEGANYVVLGHRWDLGSR